MSDKESIDEIGAALELSNKDIIGIKRTKKRQSVNFAVIAVIQTIGTFLAGLIGFTIIPGRVIEHVETITTTTNYASTTYIIYPFTIILAGMWSSQISISKRRLALIVLLLLTPIFYFLGLSVGIFVGQGAKIADVITTTNTVTSTISEILTVWSYVYTGPGTVAYNVFFVS